MKKIGKIFYILIVLGILGFLLYKEFEFAGELKVLKTEKAERQQEIKNRLDEDYQPRKEDFYKEAEVKEKKK